MNTKAYADIDVLVVDGDSTVRQTIRNILQNHNIRRVAMSNTFAGLQTHLKNATPDLLIADYALADGDFGDFVQEIRHNKTKVTPFLPVIATVWNPTKEILGTIIAAGVDHIVGKPLSANQLINRIRAVATKRKAFVVTSHYIGPDRRGDDEREGEIETITVPCTLSVKVAGGDKAELATLKSQMEDCAKKINIQKLDRDAGQVMYLAGKIMPDIRAGNIGEGTIDLLRNLHVTAREISSRMAGTPYEHVSNLCETLIEVTDRILESPDNPDEKDLRLLEPLSHSIRAGFAECGATTKRMAKAIHDSLSASGTR